MSKDFCTNCVNEYAWSQKDKKFPKECIECEVIDGKPSNFKPESKTNGDRIREMTDEELAKWIDGMYCECVWCDVNNPNCCDMECTECIEIWLKKPAEEEV